MNKLEMIQKLRQFLDRSPIVGAEAAEMVICQQWLANTEKAIAALEPSPPQRPQVADMSGK